MLIINKIVFDQLLRQAKSSINFFNYNRKHSSGTFEIKIKHTKLAK
jgi:hypothetical protein